MTAAAVLTGCASNVAGTWVASGGADAQNPIARVSFCSDGTFTAEADYGSGKSHAMSGCYCVKGDKITFCMDDKMREYGYKVAGDCLEISHEGKTGKLCRVKGCSSAKCCEGGTGAAGACPAKKS
jgi:hypothetical protein